MHNGATAEIIVSNRLTMDGCLAAAAFYQGPQVRAECRQSSVMAAAS
jgi:hypothetical protein